MLGLVVVVGGIVLAAHWPALSAAALSFDDTQYLTDNALVRNPSWRNAGRFLGEVLEPSTVRGYYQPLAMISLMLDHALGGRADHLLPFHRTSLGLHVTNSVLVILLLYLLFGNAWVAAMVGLLFGIHPMCVEPIPWVGERKTLLAAFFALLCLIAYVRFARTKSRASFACSLAAYVLALMSKPTGTPIAAVLLLLDVWPLRRLGRRAVLEKTPFFVLALVSSIITYVSQNRTAILRLPGEGTFSPLRIPLTICHNIVFYPCKMLWPADLSSHYPFPQPMSLSNPVVLGGVIGTLVLAAALVASLRWTRALVVGWSVFFLAILPTLGIVGFTNVIASDKYAYLPVVGFLLPLAYFLARMWGMASKGSHPSKRRIAMVVVAGLVATLEVRATRRQLTYWKDTESFHGRMIGLAPDAAILRNNLSYFLLLDDKVDQAVEHLTRALQISPDYADAHHNMGVALLKLGRIEEAVSHYNRALQSSREPARLHHALGVAFSRQGRIDQAVLHYREALGLKPDFAEAHDLLGVALTRTGELEKALEHLAEAVRLRPDQANMHNDLGVALKKQGRIDEAIAAYNEALRIDPDFVKALNNLGGVLGRRGQREQAVELFRKAIRVDPDNAMSHLLLGVTLDEMDRRDEAVAEFQQAIRCDPENAKAYLRLGSALRKQGRIAEAMETFREVARIDPDNAAAHHNLGYGLANEGRFDEAITEYRAALRTKPRDAELHCSLGVLLQRQDRIEEAVTEFREALRIDASMPEARKRLDAILAKHGEPGSP